MKHLVIGCGMVGNATRYVLEKIGEDVFCTDKNREVLAGKRVGSIVDDYDIYWICTNEWDTEKVVAELENTDKIVVIRSTSPPGFTNHMEIAYDIKHIAHVPEFLREKHWRYDVMHPDRVIIGSYDAKTVFALKKLFKKVTTYVYVSSPEDSEMTKLVSNAYLSAQISFWNEIKNICRANNINPNVVANLVSKDKRVSSYGHSKFGKYGGHCLPKDIASLILYAKFKCPLLKAVQEVNDNEQ